MLVKKETSDSTSTVKMPVDTTTVLK